MVNVATAVSKLSKLGGSVFGGAPWSTRREAPRAGGAAAPAGPDPAALTAARTVLRGCRRPVIIAGLQAAEPGAAEALQGLARAWGAPVLATYMAKGSFPDNDPLAVGPFIAGAAEEPLLRGADAILLFGADPIEFLPVPWRHAAPTVMLTTHAFDRRFHPWTAEVVGSLADSAARLAEAVAPGGWSPAATPIWWCSIMTCSISRPSSSNPSYPRQ